MPTRFLSCAAANSGCILSFKLFNAIFRQAISGGRCVKLRRSEARGQRASDQHPATSASSGQRPEHQSPQPSTLVEPIGCGMVPRDAMHRRQPYRDCELAEDPRLPSHNNHSRAERNPAGPYACRGPVVMLSRDNCISQSVAEHPSRLEFP